MTKMASFVLGIVIILGVGGLVFYQTQSARSASAATNQSVSNTGNTQNSALITAAEIAVHKDGTSCWSSINGNVYDLTSWIPQHPGGPEAILSICGIDGSAKFNAQHGGSPLQEQILAGFKIGTLAK